jgi:hypothetical protein
LSQDSDSPFGVGCHCCQDRTHDLDRQELIRGKAHLRFVSEAEGRAELQRRCPEGALRARNADDERHHRESLRVASGARHLDESAPARAASASQSSWVTDARAGQYDGGFVRIRGKEPDQQMRALTSFFFTGPHARSDAHPPWSGFFSGIRTPICVQASPRSLACSHVARRLFEDNFDRLSARDLDRCGSDRRHSRSALQMPLPFCGPPRAPLTTELQFPTTPSQLPPSLARYSTLAPVSTIDGPAPAGRRCSP